MSNDEDEAKSGSNQIKIARSSLYILSGIHDCPHEDTKSPYGGRKQAAANQARTSTGNEGDMTLCVETVSSKTETCSAIGK